MLPVKSCLSALSFLLVVALAGFSADATVLEGSVFVDDSGAVKFVEGISHNATAYGSYDNAYNKTGWGVLNIKAGHGVQSEDNKASYAAGYLEGVLTANEIWINYQNIEAFYFKARSQQVVNDVKKFLTDQKAWAASQVLAMGSSDVYWRHMGYILSQLNGLHDGYVSAAPKGATTDMFVLLVLNSVGDLIDLITALDPKSRDPSEMTDREFKHFVHSSGHCSAIIKVTPGLENVFFSHSSWFTYSSTLRIYKIYSFDFGDPETSIKSMAFSSYPGFLESLDDFYLLGGKMVLLQTTNNIFNILLYKLVTEKSLLAWQRVRVANFLANSGSQWYNTVARYNSGTYNNQYMIIDLRKIQPEQAILDDALWVVEQIPGLVMGADQTTLLRAGYWPSYNVPVYEEIYNKSGYPGAVKQRGTMFSYQLAPRAKIFRRDQSTVHDLQSLKDLMRYNDYKNDKYSGGSPWGAICSRGDLDPENTVPNGCYDTKVADFKMAQKMEASIINGPTQSHGLPAFSWAPSFVNYPHKDLPEQYNFDWLYVKPN